MTKSLLPATLPFLLLLAACGGEPSPAPSGSAKPAATGGAGTGAAAAPPLTGKLVEVDLSSAGADYKGLSQKGPGAPKLLSKPGAPSIAFERTPTDPNAPLFTVEISHDKLDVKSMKEWVTDWAKGFSTPGKITYVTDKENELEYSVELKLEDGTQETAHGYGTEVKVGGETYSCSAPNLSGKDLPILKGVCQTLAKK